MRFALWPNLTQPWADVLEGVRHAEATGWDGVYDLDRAGPPVWREMISRFEFDDLTEAGVLWANAFDPTQPIATPGGLAAAPAGGPSSDPVLQNLARAVQVHTQIAGTRPLGFYQGRTSPHTRRLCVEEGGFLYDADSYADDLPYWDLGHGRPHLVVPYTLDVNDMRFSSPAGFNCGDQFFAYLRDTFDQLWAEGAEAPKMMSVGLHPRLVGRPGRAIALARFLDHVLSHERVWVCRRIDIAQAWRAQFPPPNG